jgi:hypothetical protein
MATIIDGPAVEPGGTAPDGHVHSWQVLKAQEAPPRTIALARCSQCRELATWLLEGTWDLGELRGL